jgi:hypothetical protein
MPTGNTFKTALGAIFNIGVSEETTKQIRRVQTMQDLTQTITKETSFDPAVGRRVSAELRSPLLTASGHRVPSSDAILGECVACRADAEADGEPERVNVIAKGSTAGGTCRGCGGVFCCGQKHGSFDEENVFWCENCKYSEKLKKLEGAVVNVLFGRWKK